MTASCLTFGGYPPCYRWDCMDAIVEHPILVIAVVAAILLIAWHRPSALK